MIKYAYKRGEVSNKGLVLYGVGFMVSNKSSTKQNFTGLISSIKYEADDA